MTRQETGSHMIAEYARDGAILYLREAGIEDMDRLYRWRNDPVVRQNSFSKEEIPYAAHKIWFDAMMENPDRHQYILMLEADVAAIPVGQLRLDLEAEGVEISYSVAENFRNNGCGTAVLKLAAKQAQKDFPQAGSVFGKVLKDNIPSACAFARAGYEKIENETEDCDTFVRRFK